MHLRKEIIAQEQSKRSTVAGAADLVGGRVEDGLVDGDFLAGGGQRGSFFLHGVGTVGGETLSGVGDGTVEDGTVELNFFVWVYTVSVGLAQPRRSLPAPNRNESDIL